MTMKPIFLWLLLFPHQLPTEFAENLEVEKFRQPMFHPRGPNAAKYIKHETEGLRIVIPQKEKALPPIGVVTRYRIRGDFQITAPFSILDIDAPTSGYGSGASLYILKESKTEDIKEEFASVVRALHHELGNCFFAYRGWMEKNGTRRKEQEVMPTDAKSGKLRFVRHGSTLYYFAAEGDSSDFLKIYETNFGNEDLVMIQLAANTGGSPTGLDVRFNGLRIQADEIPELATKPSNRSWIPWIAGGVIITVAVCAVVLLWRKKQMGGGSADG